jgi:predicted membrane channel-forming protein YqfA (hemolysin III family)
MSSVPDGYRTGFITALTVFLGFSLAFLRFWAMEAPGEWSPHSVAAASVLGFAILLQLIALFRALDVRDNEELHYRVTVRWFLSGVIVLIVGVVVSIASSNAI